MDTQRKVFVTAPIMFAALFLAACSSTSEQPQTPATGVSAIENALTSPIMDCQTEHAACVGSAKSLTDAQACQTALGDCLKDASTQAQGTATDLQDCRDAALACVKAGGAAAAQSCRTDYETCVQAALPTPPAGGGTGSAGTSGGLPTPPPGFPGGGGAGTTGGLPTPPPGFPGGGGAGTTGGLPTPPPGFPGGGGTAGTAGGFPGLPGGGTGGMPNLPPAFGCLKDLRTCVQAANSDPNKCATDARACLKTALGMP